MDVALSMWHLAAAIGQPRPAQANDGFRPDRADSADMGFRLAPIPDIRKTTLSPPETSVSSANNSKLGRVR